MARTASHTLETCTAGSATHPHRPIRMLVSHLLEVPLPPSTSPPPLSSTAFLLPPPRRPLLVSVLLSASDRTLVQSWSGVLRACSLFGLHTNFLHVGSGIHKYVPISFPPRPCLSIRLAATLMPLVYNRGLCTFRFHNCLRPPLFAQHMRHILTDPACLLLTRHK